MYELDQLASEIGLDVLSLLPYHCQYNPVKLLWAQVKSDIANNNTTFRFADV